MFLIQKLRKSEKHFNIALNEAGNKISKTQTEKERGKSYCPIY